MGEALLLRRVFDILENARIPALRLLAPSPQDAIRVLKVALVSSPI